MSISTRVRNILRIALCNRPGANEFINQVDYTHKIVAAGSVTTAGGAAAEVISVEGVLSTDTVIAVLKAVGAGPVTILTVEAGTDQITVTFSGDPSNDHEVSYEVIRAV